MTVLQIVKALAGEEDINWGDSDTTFTRQTRNGGTTSIHYVDSKSIPANTLGGVIDTHLHAQNTDTGTTAGTFTIDSDADSAILSTAGLSTDRTFTFPNTQTTQQLIGATDLAGTSASQGASLVGIRDTAGNYTNTTVEGALSEIATSVAAILLPYGYKRGFVLDFVTTGTISLTRGIWHHSGTTDQMVYSASSISYNPSGLSGTQMQYIYLDDSAIVSSGSQVITSSQITNSTTAPSYSNTKFGWYNGNDRCIGHLVIVAGLIMKFRVVSDNFYAYYTITDLYSGSNAPTAATSFDISANVPAFCTRCRIAITNATDGNNFIFSIGGAWPIGNGITMGKANAVQSIEIELDTDQTFEWSADTASATNLRLLGVYMGDL